MNSIKLLPRVDSVDVFRLDDSVFVIARGETPSAGYDPVLLMGSHYPNGEPSDGTWLFSLVGAEPEVAPNGGSHIVRAFAVGPKLSQARTIVVRSTTNHIEVSVDDPRSLSSVPADTLSEYVERLHVRVDRPSGGGRFTDN